MNKVLSTILLMFISMYGVIIYSQDLKWAENMGGKLGNGTGIIHVDGMQNVYTTGSFTDIFSLKSEFWNFLPETGQEL